jgi:hypothetical protein
MQGRRHARDQPVLMIRALIAHLKLQIEAQASDLTRVRSARRVLLDQLGCSFEELEATAGRGRDRRRDGGRRTTKASLRTARAAPRAPTFFPSTPATAQAIQVKPVAPSAAAPSSGWSGGTGSVRSAVEGDQYVREVLVPGLQTISQPPAPSTWWQKGPQASQFPGHAAVRSSILITAEPAGRALCPGGVPLSHRRPWPTRLAPLVRRCSQS